MYMETMETISVYRVLTQEGVVLFYDPYSAIFFTEDRIRELIMDGKTIKFLEGGDIICWPEKELE